MGEAWIVDAVRTPRAIGKVGKGALAGMHPQRILATVLKALEKRNDLTTEEVDDVISGCGVQVGKQASCIARMATLDAGWSIKTPGFSLDRFCGSSLTAVNLAAMGIMSGLQNLVVAGGVEAMSYTFALDFDTPFIDSGNEHLRKIHPQPHQGICADLIATLEGISREDADQMSVESQRRADQAIRNGYFENSVVPVYNDDGSILLDREEYPRPQTTLEALSALKPSFTTIYDQLLDDAGTTFRSLVKQTYSDVDVKHIHHAGNSSGIVDGAGALLLTSPEYAKANGMKPRARIVTAVTAANSPELMLDAPVPAAEKALRAAGMTISDIDLFEVNEAFAVVPIKFMRHLGVNYEKLNVNGGAIALGHPIGATGAILLGTLLDEMERRNLNVGMVTMCTGGGMAPATIIERI